MKKIALVSVITATVITASLVYFSSDKMPQTAASSPNQDSSHTAAATPNMATGVIAAAPTANVMQNTAPNQNKPMTLDEAYLELPDSNPAYPTFGDRVSEISARRSGKVFDVAALHRATSEKSAWEKADFSPESLDLTDEELTDGREFIKLNPLKLESLVKGDQLELRVDQIGQTYTVIIDDVASNDDGRNITWTGAIKDLEGYQQVTITRGDDLIIGGITTPEGLFQLQGTGEKGWIVNSATLFKGVDQQVVVPDELIANPPQDLVYLPAETFGDTENHTH